MWLLDRKGTAGLRLAAPAALCREEKYLSGSALEKPHLSSLRLLLEKHLEETVRGGPRGGPGPGCEAEGGRLVGGWEEVEETAPF